MTGFTECAIGNNAIDCVPNPDTTTVDFNRIGVQVWTPMFNSSITHNTIRHAQYGIYFMSYGSSRMVQGSNIIRDNIISELMLPIGSKEITCGLYDGNGGPLPKPNTDQFHSLGNHWRGNLVKGAFVGALAGMEIFGSPEYLQNPANCQSPKNTEC